MKRKRHSFFKCEKLLPENLMKASEKCFIKLRYIYINKYCRKMLNKFITKTIKISNSDELNTIINTTYQSSSLLLETAQ